MILKFKQLRSKQIILLNLALFALFSCNHRYDPTPHALLGNWKINRIEVGDEVFINQSVSTLEDGRSVVWDKGFQLSFQKDQLTIKPNGGIGSDFSLSCKTAYSVDREGYYSVEFKGCDSTFYNGKYQIEAYLDEGGYDEMILSTGNISFYCTKLHIRGLPL